MRDQDHPRVAKLNISSRYLVDEIDGESFRLFCPPFADELVWHQASKRRQPAGVNRICRLYRAEGLPMHKREPTGVLSVRMRKSSSRQRPLPAGRRISSTINTPAADACATSMSSTMSRKNWRNFSATGQARHDCLRQRNRTDHECHPCLIERSQG